LEIFFLQPHISNMLGFVGEYPTSVVRGLASHTYFLVSPSSADGLAGQGLHAADNNVFFKCGGGCNYEAGTILPCPLYLPNDLVHPTGNLVVPNIKRVIVMSEHTLDPNITIPQYTAECGIVVGWRLPYPEIQTRYLFGGVCHQMANRLLYACDPVNPRIHRAEGTRWTYIQYKHYGKKWKQYRRTVRDLWRTLNL